MKHARIYRNRGGTIIEWVAGAVLFIPLLFMIIFTVLEVSRAYAIKVSVEEAARRAARQLATDYGIDPVGNSSTAHQLSIYTNIRIPTVVADNSQFSGAAYALGPAPQTVSVTVTYPPNGIPGVLPPFPDIDPLRLRGQIQINSIATFPLY
jgi:hypothetical protein